MARVRRGDASPVVALARQAFFIFLMLSIAFPFYYMTVNALKTRQEYALERLGLPSSPTMENFATLLQEGSIIIWYRNSVILTGTAVLASLVIASLAAFVFSRVQFRGRTLFYRLIISLMVIPPIVLIIPLFISAVRIGVVNTHAAAVVVYTGLLMPFSVFLLTSFFRTIPSELLDAARVDGANSLRTLWHVIVPLAKPALMTLGLVNALWVWNDLLIALVFLQDESLRTLMVGVAQFRSRYAVNVPVMMAGLVLASWPAIVAYVLGQRYFTEGLTAGAVRG